MSGVKGATFDNDLLKMILNGTAIANLCDNAATSPFTVLYLALHTADPTAAGSQTSSEATYTSYARVSVARTAGGWTISTNTFTNAATITFPACTGGTNTILFFSIGTASSGAGKILYTGPTSSLAVSSGITPSFAAGALTGSEA